VSSFKSTQHQLSQEELNIGVVQTVTERITQLILHVDEFQHLKLYNEKFHYGNEGLKSQLQEWLGIAQGYLQRMRPDSECNTEIDLFNEWRSKQTSDGVQPNEAVIQHLMKLPKKSRVEQVQIPEEVPQCDEETRLEAMRETMRAGLRPHRPITPVRQEATESSICELSP
jgi:hypothetical protein